MECKPVNVPILRVYISGHINLEPVETKRMFGWYSKLISLRGLIPVNPHDIKAYHPDTDKPCPRSYSEGNGHSSACWLRGDFIELLKCDAIFMLGDWESSVGAQREHSVAAWTGIPIHYDVNTLPDRRL
jgi:uncharacterized protein DUF4406